MPPFWRECSGTIRRNGLKGESDATATKVRRTGPRRTKPLGPNGKCSCKLLPNALFYFEGGKGERGNGRRGALRLEGNTIPPALMREEISHLRALGFPPSQPSPRKVRYGILSYLLTALAYGCMGCCLQYRGKVSRYLTQWNCGNKPRASGISISSDTYRHLSH